MSVVYVTISPNFPESDTKLHPVSYKHNSNVLFSNLSDNKNLITNVENEHCITQSRTNIVCGPFWNEFDLNVVLENFKINIGLINTET